MVAVILGLYTWVSQPVDLGFYILFAIPAVLGIGYSVVYGGAMISLSFVD